MSRDEGAAVPTEPLTEFSVGLATRLWIAAHAVDPEWDYSGIFLWMEPGHLSHVEECVTRGISDSAWPREGVRPVEDFVMEWWERQYSAGTRMWSVMFLAGRRSSGDFESFLAYPDSPEQWNMPFGQERAVFDRAYANLGWQR